MYGLDTTKSYGIQLPKKIMEGKYIMVGFELSVCETHGRSTTVINEN